MRPRPGPPLETHTSSTGKKKSQTPLTYIFHSWLTLTRTILRARRLKDVMLFLAAWFLLSDAIATVSGTAILYAKTTLGMQPASLALINVIVMVFGVIGALAWTHVSRYFRLKPVSYTHLTLPTIYSV